MDFFLNSFQSLVYVPRFWKKIFLGRTRLPGYMTQNYLFPTSGHMMGLKQFGRCIKKSYLYLYCPYRISIFVCWIRILGEVPTPVPQEKTRYKYLPLENFTLELFRGSYARLIPTNQSFCHDKENFHPARTLNTLNH